MALRQCFAAHWAVTKMELAMQKQWILEMHHPGHARDSLITTDRFGDFAEVEQKIKQNRELVFAVKPPTAPGGRVADARRVQKIRIKNRVTVEEGMHFYENRGSTSASPAPAELGP